VKPRFVTAVLALLLAGAAAFALTDALLSSVTVDGFWAALLAAAFAGRRPGERRARQSFAFVLGPTAFAWPDAPIVGAEAMHRVMRRWLADLGQEAYGEP
jgi:hypothetical protein